MPRARRVPSDMLEARNLQEDLDWAMACRNSRVSLGPIDLASTPLTPETTLERYSSIRFLVSSEWEVNWARTLARLPPSRNSSSPASGGWRSRILSGLRL